MATPTLPARASVEFLRKQAKHLHRAFAEGETAALARIRAHLPRAGRLAVDQLRSLDLSLQEAQHALACEYGFGKWEALLAAAQPRFEDLAGLTDEHAQRLLREVDQRDIVGGCLGAPHPVLMRFLRNMSERVSRFITEEMAFAQGASATEVEESRRRILDRVTALAARGEITWPPAGAQADGGPPERPRPQDERLAHLDRPLAALTEDEIAGILLALAELARRDGILVLEPLTGPPPSLLKEGIERVVDGTEPDLVADLLGQRARTVLRHRRIHGRICVESWMSIQAGASPGIVRVRAETYYLEAASRIPDTPRPVTVESLLRRVGESPVSAPGTGFGDLAELFHDMAWCARQEGIATLAPLAEAVADEPELRLGLELPLSGGGPDEVREGMVACLEAALVALDARQRMVIVGLTQIQRGRPPEQIVASARAAADAARADPEEGRD